MYKSLIILFILFIKFFIFGIGFPEKQLNLVNEVSVIVRKMLHAPVKPRFLVGVDVIRNLFGDRERVNELLTKKNNTLNQ